MTHARTPGTCTRDGPRVIHQSRKVCGHAAASRMRCAFGRTRAVRERELAPNDAGTSDALQASMCDAVDLTDHRDGRVREPRSRP